VIILDEKTTDPALQEQLVRQRLCLSRGQAMILFGYYTFALLVGLAIASYVLSQDASANSDSTHFYTVMGGIGMALVGSTIYYLRKLYKELISDTLEVSNSAGSESRRLGLFVYFATRPLFAIGFSLLAYAAISGGISASVKGNFQTSSGLLHIVMVISFICGFLAGNVLKQLEDFGPEIIANFRKGQ
jgi:hypothetical protein